MKKFDVGHYSVSEGKPDEDLSDPDKQRSFEAEALVECLERAKSSLSGISQSAKQLFSDDAGTLLATERMEISSLDLENLKNASNEENFYFPLLSVDLRKKEFASVEIRRDKKLILDSIKQDLVELAIRLSEVSPILSELMTGIPSSISESLKLLSTSQRRNWLSENRYLEAIQTCTLLLSSLFDEAERGDSFTTRATPEVLSETVWFNDFQPT